MSALATASEDAQAALSDVRSIATALQGFTTLEGLVLAEKAAKRAEATLRDLRMQMRAMQGEERRRRRDVAAEKARSDASNERIMAERARA